MARDHVDALGTCTTIAGFISPVSAAYGKQGLSSARHRVAMCRLAVNDSRWISVDAWESQSSTHLSTVEVLQSLQRRVSLSKRHSNAKVWLLMGSDVFRSFSVPDLWSRSDQISIVQDYGLVVVARTCEDNLTDQEYAATNPILQGLESTIHFVPQPIVNQESSSMIRMLLSNNRSIRYLVAHEVCEYIERHALYSNRET